MPIADRKISERDWFWGPLLLTILLFGLVYFTGSNQRLFFWLNHLSRYTGDPLWACLTLFGDGMVFPVLLLPWIRKRPDVVVTALLAFLVTSLTVQGLKFIFAAPRPLVVLAPQMFHVIGKHLAQRSFPSGHTADIFTLAGVWLCVVPKTWQRVALLMFAAVVGISRVVVGAHWPVDVLAGALLGWSGAWFGYALGKRWFRAIPVRWQRFLGIGLLVAAIVLLGLYGSGYPQSLWLQRSIALVGLLWGGFEFMGLLRKTSLPPCP